LAALRAFLLHLRHRGKIKTDLAACVPTIANWSHATLPKFLPAGQVDQVLKHCDRRHTTGRRDYAILLLLARLGLRAGEVAALTLDAIDWKEGNLRLRGKGGREVELPLPRDVGKAITGYLQNGRPRCASRRLFIRERAPRVGLASGAISNLVKRTLVRPAVHAPRQGAHLFRHYSVFPNYYRVAETPRVDAQNNCSRCRKGACQPIGIVSSLYRLFKKPRRWSAGRYRLNLPFNGFVLLSRSV